MNMATPKLILFTSLLLFVQENNSLPAPGHDVLPPINWDNIKPRFPTFTPQDPETDLDQELLMKIMNMGPQVSDRYTGYTKGTKSMVGDCGIPGKSEKIVGGTEASPHSYPWMAALVVDDSWFCGGTLISDEWILTAGHCVVDSSSIRVMLGAHNVQEESEEGRIELITTDFILHFSYNPTVSHNDLALVHLPYSINFTDTIRPVCLPKHSESGEKWDNLDAQASGWGEDSDSATSVSPVLRHVTVDTITNLMCALQFPTIINHNIICISGDKGKSTCKADSGGPLHLVNNGVYKQIGITSFGSPKGCEDGSHAGFTRTASYLEWIGYQAGIYIEP